MIGNFYDAVIDRWQTALDDMRSYFGFHIGALGAIALPTGNSVVQVTPNIRTIISPE